MYKMIYVSTSGEKCIVTFNSYSDLYQFIVKSPGITIVNVDYPPRDTSAECYALLSRILNIRK